MADIVTLANLAVARLGEAANIADIDPPEGSAAAELAAQFLPVARDSALQMHPWEFATDTVALTPSTITKLGWPYVYQRPSEALKVWAVLPEGAADMYSVGSADISPSDTRFGVTSAPVPMGFSVYQPVKFECGIDFATKTQIIKTKQPPNAYGRCTFRIEDPTLWSPLFADTLSWLWAMNMAGPIYKGQTGIKVTASVLAIFKEWFSMSVLSDTQESHENVQQAVPWLTGR